MNMFARFDENPAMTLQDIKETKRYGRTDGCTDARTDTRRHGQHENSIPTTNKVCRGYKNSVDSNQTSSASTAKSCRTTFTQYACKENSIKTALNPLYTNGFFLLV